MTITEHSTKVPPIVYAPWREDPDGHPHEGASTVVVIGRPRAAAAAMRYHGSVKK
jgi:hypothetical protein